MSRASLRHALEAVTAWPGPPQVHLTGGEPFLHFDLLVHGARVARELGITCYVETSGAWCRDLGFAVGRLHALRDAGLQAVLISVSPFHAERIPPERALLAVRAAMDVFGPDGVIVYLPEFVGVVTQHGLDRTTPLERYVEDLGGPAAGRLLWDAYGLIAGGRSGYRLGHLVAGRPAEAFAGDDCLAEVLLARHSHLDLYGNFTPGFCGGLSMGDWRKLSQILSDCRAGRLPRLLAELVAHGPHGLYEVAAREADYRQRPEGYAGKCHLCVDVRRHLAARADHPELQPREFYLHFDG